MIKRYCDCCGKETKCIRDFSYYCHIDDLIDGKFGYIDQDGNMISGRSVHNEFCPACYNRIVMESVKKFRELHNKPIQDIKS